jgi:hypothetical protein
MEGVNFVRKRGAAEMRREFFINLQTVRVSADARAGRNSESELTEV